jgi:hypothetical protein
MLTELKAVIELHPQMMCVFTVAYHDTWVTLMGGESLKETS